MRYCLPNLLYPSALAPTYNQPNSNRLLYQAAYRRTRISRKHRSWGTPIWQDWRVLCNPVIIPLASRPYRKSMELAPRLQPADRGGSRTFSPLVIISPVSESGLKATRPIRHAECLCGSRTLNRLTYPEERDGIKACFIDLMRKSAAEN